MKILKKIIISIILLFASRLAQAQTKLSHDTITMYCKSLDPYRDYLVYSKDFVDTLDAINYSERVGSKSLILYNSDDVQDVFDMCKTKNTPNEIQLIRIGKNLYKISGRCIVRIDEKTIAAIFKGTEKPIHSHHASHTSHSSHYSSR